ncbi:unnamed protein product [Chondrus crispus]|uniref:Uncharacterized protein n=1 Tax=Chondrus crispus TaxID=2769 RepID=R7QF18_CHOCR|nr:unnamed protein product [Chondrus crispus]CDF37112.1 unnamed protein product [Chondrus crispus]|eukprot:XP_005716931.1 unnamed protein product [Chondrus crispus]
MEYRQVRKLI